MDNKHRLQIILWLGTVCLLVCLMVVVGGVTRLTESGLSMVEWKPLLGAVPPISEQEWLETFDKYKQFPQYKSLGHEMSLSEFQFIFFWEYGHRLLGRLIGLVFFLPFLFFWLKGYFDKKLTVKLLIGLMLGGLQGLMGWYMVKSGLVDIPRVSHYRLAAHLSLAFLIFAYLLWLIFELRAKEPLRLRLSGMAVFSIFITSVVSLQVIYGALVAGSRAGYLLNTFPKMGGKWIPEGWLLLEPAWLNPFENLITIQFVHRLLAYGLSVLVIVFWWKVRSLKSDPRSQQAGQLLLASLFIQFLLGVLTLILYVPLGIAVAHQAGALLVLGAALYANYSTLTVNHREP